MYFLSLIVLIFVTLGISTPVYERRANEVLDALTKRTVSPDGSCGGTNEYICPANECCSPNGYWYVLMFLIYERY